MNNLDTTSFELYKMLIAKSKEAFIITDFVTTELNYDIEVKLMNKNNYEKAIIKKNINDNSIVMMDNNGVIIELENIIDMSLNDHYKRIFDIVNNNFGFDIDITKLI